MTEININEKIKDFYNNKQIILTNYSIPYPKTYTKDIKAIFLMTLINKITHNSFAITKTSINNKLVFIIAENETDKAINNLDSEFLYTILLPYFYGKKLDPHDFDILSSQNDSTMIMKTNIKI